MFIGGCSGANPPSSIEAWWDETQENWNEFYVYDGSNEVEDAEDRGNGIARRTFNLEQGQLDRVAFRIPKTYDKDEKFRRTGARKAD